MKSRISNWTDIRAFLAVFREGSTLAASRRLGVAQPTVARRIEVLEHELHLSLFDRDTRGFRPTRHARALYPKAEAIEAAMTALEAEANSLATPRPIRITAYSANFSPRANKIFSDFSARHPHVRLEFLPTQLMLDLEKGEADIALRLTRSAPSPNLVCRKISTARYSLFGSRDYAKKHGLPTSPEDLSGHTFVTFERDDVPTTLHDWLACRVKRDQILLSFSEFELMHAAIRSGVGLGLLNLKLVEQEPDLVRCFEPIDELAAEHLMLISSEAYKRPEVRKFTKFFAPRYAALFKPHSKT
ncbi:DNA-binding transcriptional LysR family regulator [Labrenzia sp. MBR-25]